MVFLYLIFFIPNYFFLNYFIDFISNLACLFFNYRYEIILKIDMKIFIYQYELKYNY